MSQPLDELLATYFDGSLTNAQTSQLREICRERPDVVKLIARLSLLEDQLRELGVEADTRKAGFESKSLIEQPLDDSSIFWEAIELERAARIKREAEEALERQQAAEREKRRRASWARMMGIAEKKPVEVHKRLVIPTSAFYGGVAALLAVALWVGWSAVSSLSQQVSEEFADERAQPVVVERPVVATLIRTLDAVWAERHVELRPGEEHEAAPLQRGVELREGDSYKLLQGFAQLDTQRGAIVVLEAPCEIELLGENQVKLTRGRLVGRCPTQESKGLTVNTPSAHVVDLGTEFGVLVDPNQRTQVAVFDGEVETRVTNASGQAIATERIHRFEAVEVAAGSSRIERIDLPSLEQTFVRDLEEEQFDSGVLLAQAILNDRPIAYWPLDESAGAQVARDATRHQFDGSIPAGVSFGEAVGLGGSQLRGARFDGSGYIDIGTPRQLELRHHFTVQFMARFDKVEGKCGWLIASYKGGRNDRQSAIPTGNRGWGVGYNVPRFHTLDEWHPGLNFTLFGHHEYFFTKFQPAPGKWQHFTVVCDVNADVSLYVDGVFVEKVAGTGVPLPLPRCRMTIGGIDNPTGGSTGWEGAMCSVAVYGHALSEEQIAAQFAVLGEGLGDDRVEP